MTTFDIDREIRETLQEKWKSEELSDDDKVSIILKMVQELPVAERRKMFRRLKAELKRLGFLDEDPSNIPY